MRCGEEKRGRRGIRGREREVQTKSERRSCGLNSGQLFKACARSGEGAAAIKEAVSEEATDARGEGTHRLAGEKQKKY